LGGSDAAVPQLEDDGENFYFSKRYECELSRFIDIKPDELDIDECISCKCVFLILHQNFCCLTWF